MQTYTGGTQDNKQGGENVEQTNPEEDMFVSGGYDSFGGAPKPMNTGMGQMNTDIGQMNTDMWQLGSVGYGIGNANGTVDDNTTSTNRWSEPRVILNLWGQLFNSFMPFRYDRYKGMSINAAKDFVKFFVKLNLIVNYLAIIILILTVPAAREYVKSGNITILLFIILFGVSYAIGAFINPYFFRLWAFIYRVIFGNLLMAIEKKNVNFINMYLISIYSCVPCITLGMLLVIMALFCLYFPAMLATVLLLSTICGILALIMPIVIMALAIPRME